MKLSDSTQRYGTLTQTLHWLSAVLVIGLFGLGLWMVELGYYDDWYHDAPALHISFGLVLAALTVIRMLWRAVQNGSPPLEGSRVTRAGASASKIMLYLLLLFMAVSGYLITGADGSGADFFELATLPSLLTLGSDSVDLLGELHEWAAWGLILLAAGHGLAALYHHFIARDLTLARMLPFTQTGEHNERR
ncbi:cytochrome b [Simiduia agarivorans]|uniref:Cytochrome b561-like protein n=1 Tax=Simiduia agarivorans (strain DSM 21679 / JCM 13881 / BCRC 17597 / SA1) TaxID=1117647 RepID=K4KLT0_SIMAS|nr:cytochrome b [Simiduia agarivorans]AFV00135.1 Cytochrome b561-like protein [Simiduia agarivorans SA1 = DSM 21679]